jgi:hypothetical protein
MDSCKFAKVLAFSEETYSLERPVTAGAVVALGDARRHRLTFRYRPRELERREKGELTKLPINEKKFDT